MTFDGEWGVIVADPRSGSAFTGLILAPILVAGRQRLLLLKSSGEIWPVSANDIQFVMPASLIPRADVDKCWYPELLSLWANGEDIGLSVGGEAESNLLGQDRVEEMSAARRRVATVLRRVQRETEKMEARLSGGTLKAGRGGGIEAVWDMFVPSDPDARGSVTSCQVAEHLLNAEGAGEDGTKRISVRPSTLPAFAAHSLLMRRPDLFVAADKDMWSSGTFLVRSRNERARAAEVARLVDESDPALFAFVEKAKKIKALLEDGSTDIPEWTEQEKDIISVLFLPLFEQRSTQRRERFVPVTAIAKLFDVESSGSSSIPIEFSAVAQVLSDIGAVPHTDSLRTSIVNETMRRSFTMRNIVADNGSALPEPTAADAALDSLRSDFSHRVFVIDDASAEELDDGVAVERVGDNDFWIHIHVADPTRHIERDGALATHASVFGTTVYLPESTIPLLPTGGSASLGAGQGSERQPSMVFSARVDRAGNMNDYKVAMGFTKGAVVTTYDDVNEALNIKTGHLNNPFGYLPRDRGVASQRSHATLSAEDTADLQLLRELSDGIRAKRFANAGFEWWATSSTIKVLNPSPLDNVFDRNLLPSQASRTPEPQFQYTVSSPQPPTTSQSIVAELMVLANRVVAKFCVDHNVPVPFRGMAAPKETSSTPAHLTIEKLLASKDPATGTISSVQFAASQLLLPNVTLTTTPLPNWLMGFNEHDQGYLRATSPLRRYDDMLVHWQVKAALGKAAGLETSMLDADEVLVRAQRANDAQDRLKVVQAQTSTFWHAGLFAQRLARPLADGYVYGVGDTPVDISGPLKAQVVSLTTRNGVDGRTTVSIPALGTKVDLRSQDMTFEFGQELDVRISQVQQWPNPGIMAVL